MSTREVPFRFYHLFSLELSGEPGTTLFTVNTTHCSKLFLLHLLQIICQKQFLFYRQIFDTGLKPRPLQELWAKLQPDRITGSRFMNLWNLRYLFWCSQFIFYLFSKLFIRRLLANYYSLTTKVLLPFVLIWG